MRIESVDDQALRRYVLGTLIEDARLALEERLISEPELFDSLKLVEDELLEAYVDGTLPEADRSPLERQIKANSEWRQRMTMFRLLARRAADSAPVKRVASSGFTYWAAHQLETNAWWRRAVAASVVALIASNVWFVLTTSRLLPTRPSGPAAPGLQTAQPPGQPAQPSSQRPALPVPAPTFVLTVGMLRGQPGSTTRIAIPDDAQTIRLRLALPADVYSRYRGALLNADGQELLSVNNLKSEAEDGGRATALMVLPTEGLARGDYQVRLAGSRTPARWNDVATYTFRITEAASATPPLIRKP